MAEAAMPRMPLYWRNETSGKLAGAIGSYLDNRIHQTSMTVEEIELVRAYLIQWIDAPGWDSAWDSTWGSGGDPELQELRLSARTLNSADEIQKWIFKALEIGIDPL